MNNVLGINSEHYIDTVLSKKIVSFKINKLSTMDNIFNGKPSDILYIIAYETKYGKNATFDWLRAGRYACVWTGVWTG